jgi:hypothetical protein
MASNGTDMLPGQSAPLTIITPTNQSGVVLIATAVAMTFGLISLLIRVFIRLEFRTEFARDDIVAAVSMVGSYQVDDRRQQLTINRYSRCFNPALYLLQPRKDSARLSRTSRPPILWSYKRYVEIDGHRQSYQRPNKYLYRLCMRVMFSTSLPFG